MRNRASEGDPGLWERATRDVARLRPRRAEPAPRPPGPAAIVRERIPAPRPAPPAVAPLEPGRFAGIDRANAERLKRGQHRIAARLDLHGMTQAEAHRAVGDFVCGSRAAGRRCVLIITGRGSAQGPHGGGGVLRAAVPRWLGDAELRTHVLAIATAQPRDGGAGALYVMLRRLPAA
jgi:DNA-nicking Smr family endonuclease